MTGPARLTSPSVSAAAEQSSDAAIAVGGDEPETDGRWDRLARALGTTAAARLALVALAGVQTLLLTYFAPLKAMLRGDPIITADYALHYYQVRRAIVSFEEAGELWSYDPLLLAGQPAGIVEDLTSKGTELAVIGLGALGVSPGL